ncbi:A disintegrin and metalloproteinase with thrombospondin motifs adt-1-like [Anthonomus grandis grandis]|uniref:A disintegrin and metalloproteinase with thrombospondin motifs adt-1-like n=1 Tax=Anthonomus grandis grandis TaxID=2921223 RepID=UPI002165C780|nr:A disintegrin and metalloproteinase with thrombospondin motifs adt-1-like [Anthonomus grandis grandis]
MRGLIGRYLLAAYIAMVSTYNTTNELIKEGDLRKQLTDEEWSKLIGDNDENFTIAYVPLTILTSNSSNHKLQIETPILGRTFDLDLEPSSKLISTDFVVLETYANGSVPYQFRDEDTRCFFRGTNTALSLCQGVNGILQTDEDHYYLIHPLPTRFHNTAHIPHLVIKKPHDLYKNKDYYKLKEKLDQLDNIKSSINKKYNDFNRENKFSNKTAVHMADFKLSNKLLKQASENKEKWSSLSNIKEPKFIQKIINRKLKRAKREVFPAGATVFVETAVFVDRDLFEHMKSNFPVDTEREIIRFVLAMVNAVQLLYHDPSLGRPVNFVLKRLEIMKDEITGLIRPPDIDRFLSNFCNWQRTKNPAGDREPLHWDHALILTGLDLYVRGKHGKISNQVVGLAPVAGMCTGTSSCTVNEGRHFESVYVVAHEIGHNLGMRHDGPLADNDCDPSSYIMSPTLGSGKITWSACSKRYLQKFLDTPQSRCLLDHGSSAGQLDHGAEGALPGERFNADQQCMLKYGRGSKHSSQQPLDDVCRDLHCERERYTWTSHPALEGTHCGGGMWCRGGRCIQKGTTTKQAHSGALKQSPEINQTNGGWSDWRNGECASGCLFGEEGRLRSGSSGIMISERFCNSPKPGAGGASCEGPERKYQTCNAQQCLNVPRLTIKEFAEQICTRAKEVDTDLTGLGMQKISSDPEEACVVWCQKRNGGTKSRGWTFPDGTTCQTRRNRYGRASYCINGKCEDFVCDPFEEAVFTQMPEVCPIDRDNNEITWTTGLRRREGTIRWKSASGCHYNCISPGSGIRLVMNKKQGKSSIQLCQPEQYGCGKVKSPFQHASIICSKYKDRVRRLSGLGMQISPSLEDPDRPCRVACQDENLPHRFYLVNGEDGWFPFGTDCSRGSTEKKAYCISGKCLGFGSDDTPLSESEFTLPLLSRNKRSLKKNGTKVIVKLKQEELDDIVDKFNKTLSGFSSQPVKIFDVDYNNPVHLHKEAILKPDGGFSDNDYPTGSDMINYT